MSVSAAIHAAKSGLQASSLRAEIAAVNVANASTPGYVRRSVLLSETMLGSQTAGVHSDGIARAPDAQIKAQRRELTSSLTQADVLASTWQSISTRLGSTPDGSSLFRNFSNFETALSAAAATPESTANLSAVLDAARGITRELNSLSKFAAELRGEADSEIAKGVTVVNSALEQVRSINARLAGMDRSSSQAASLMDERQLILGTISEFIPITAIERDYGAMDILTPEGVYLLNGSKVTPLEFSPSAAFGANNTYANGSLSGLRAGDIELTPGASSYGAVSGGLFGALFTLRDQDIPGFTAQLDMVAADLVSRLSNDAIDPTKTPGADGLFTDPTSAGTLGLASRISVNAAIDPAQGGELWRIRDGLEATASGPPGNSSMLSAMFDAFTEIRSTSGNGIQGTYTASGIVAQLSSLTGQKRIYHESVFTSVKTQHATIVEAEQSLTGVDVDRQMEDLLLIEQAYAANARVIQVASDMIRILMEL